MYRTSIACLLLALSSLLSGCFHTQLNGSVGGATITVVDPAAPGDVLFQGNSWSSDTWRSFLEAGAWDDFPGLTQLIFIGILPANFADLDPQTMYLVTATDGMENDVDGNFALDNSPTPVQGQWHALVSGARLQAGNVKISALTESAYQQLKDLVGTDSSASLLAQLNALAVTLVDDVDANQSIDYQDVISWSRTLNPGSFSGDLAVLDSLAGAVIEGASDSTLAELSNAVLESAVAGGLSGTWLITESVDGTQCDEGFYVDEYTLRVSQTGDTLLVAAPAGRFTGTLNGQVLNWSGSYAEDGGETTTSVMVTFLGDSLSGSATWTWTNGNISCSGTAQVNGVRTGA